MDLCNARGHSWQERRQTDRTAFSSRFPRKPEMDIMTQQRRESADPSAQNHNNLGLHEQGMYNNLLLVHREGGREGGREGAVIR